MSVDYVPIHLTTATTIEFDILSMETVDFQTFTDVNGDCDASFIDSEIILFKLKQGDTSLATASVVQRNDDAPDHYGNQDGSINQRDSFISVTLNPGHYVLAIGRHPLTVEDAAISKDSSFVEKRSPYGCDTATSNHGNYHLTIRSQEEIAAYDPDSSVGSKCQTDTTEIQYPLCPYHIPDRNLPIQQTLDGTIFSDASGQSTVDWIEFSLEKATMVELDMLSMETTAFNSFQDVNHDCDASFIDTAIVLFRKSENSTFLADATVVAFNDDALDEQGMTDGSISSRDSYLFKRLEPGTYVVAVSRFPLNATVASSGSNPPASRPYIFQCDERSDHGNYRLHLRSRTMIESLPSGSYRGSQCSNSSSDDTELSSCPYHVSPIEDDLPLHSELPGTIFETNEGTTVDRVYLTVDSTGPVEFDLLSYETQNFLSFYDVNGDCDASYIDSVIILYQLDFHQSIKSATIIASNDDAASNEIGRRDGSISKRDSFMSEILQPGNYVLAIGRYPLLSQDVISGYSPLVKKKTPYRCDQATSDHGNYRVSIRSNVISSSTSPGTSIGNQCLMVSNSTEFPLCPYHVGNQETIQPRASISGTIYRHEDFTTVDHISFEILSNATVILDVLSYEATDTSEFLDLSNDCDGSYLDSMIYLFHDRNEDGLLSLDELIDSNDDDQDISRRTNQKSISFRDSYLRKQLTSGKYIAALGRYPLTPQDAVLGLNKNRPELYSPMTCGNPGDHGNYQILFSSTDPLTALSPNTSIGTQCQKDGLIHSSIC